ncbi:MAG: diguanylate cyclase [Gammaproteobacteria bacterium]|nr:diguanylate cyclase [Gammaproteobacteria bacterium]
MPVSRRRQLRYSIGSKLTLIIGAVFGLYLLSVTVIGYVMYSQYRGFSTLASSHFDRAMIAAELTRDAETIAAEVFEMLVSSERSTSAGNSRAENLASIYQATRQRLDAVDTTDVVDAATRSELDRWQQPFFSSLERLDARLAAEQSLQAANLNRIDELFLLLQQLPSVGATSALPVADQRFVAHALAALSYAAAALSAERPGQIARLQGSCQQQLQQLAALPMASKGFIELRERLNSTLPTIFTSRRPLLQHERATLATARQTRVLAQKLTSATFNYHLQLKAAAQQAITVHQRMIRRSLFGLLLASLALITITVGAVIYVRRAVVLRINRLSAAMHAHQLGHDEPIPCDGHDEISLMGSTFAVFVEARRQAEQQLEQANKHLQQMNDELHRLSEIDELTRIANRRRFDQHMTSVWRRAQREQSAIGLIMADIDFFKRFNDEYGHQAGDECLHRVAQALAGELHREGDMVARYGGEEFILLLPGLNLVQTEQLAQHLLQAVRRLQIPNAQADCHMVTISLGVASVVPTTQNRVESLISRADQALYAAKHRGRDQFCSAVTDELKLMADG